MIDKVIRPSPCSVLCLVTLCFACAVDLGGAEDAEGPTETSTTVDGDGDNTTQEGEDCEPKTVELSFSLDEETYDPVDWGTLCTITGLDQVDASMTIELSECEGEGEGPLAYTLHITSTEALMLPLEHGAQVQFRWRQESPWKINRYFSLRAPDTDALLVGAVDSYDIEPLEVSNFFAPLELGVTASACKWREHDTGCGFVERQLLEVMVDGEHSSILEGGLGVVQSSPSYEVQLGEAVQWPGEQPCDDGPVSLYNALFVRM